MIVLAVIPWVIKLHEFAKFELQTKALTTLKNKKYVMTRTRDNKTLLVGANLGAKVLLFFELHKYLMDF